MRRGRVGLGIAAGALYLFLYAPIVVLVAHSFNSAKRGGPWRSFTLEWYASLLDTPEKISAALNTLMVGATSTAISTVLGAMLGYGLSRYPLRAGKLLDWLLYIPVVIPDIVMAVGMLIFYSLAREWLGLFRLGMTTMILAHVTFQIPFIAIVVRSRMAGLDPALKEAAQDLGASPWQAFRHVTLPLLFPGIIAAAALAFTLSIDDFVVSFFTTGPGATTLPILIYSSVKRGITPDINALSTVIIACSVLGTLAVAWLQGRGKDPIRP